LPAEYEDPQLALVEVTAAWETEGASGSVLLDSDGLSGYLLGAPKPSPVWGPNVWVERAGQAAKEPETIRDLYADAASKWVANGATAQYVLVPDLPELVDAWFVGLFNEVVLMWGRAKSDAMIFASFAIPRPSSPNQVTVHNWAFTSMRLADTVGRVADMKQAIEDARSQPHLKAGIELGIALSEVSADKRDFKPAEDESSEVFYASLGRRLVGIRALEPATAGPLYLELLKGCFRHGPNGMDAAPMIAVLERKPDDFAERIKEAKRIVTGRLAELLEVRSEAAECESAAYSLGRLKDLELSLQMADPGSW